MMKNAFAALLAIGIATTAAAQTAVVHYRFDDVKRTVMLNTTAKQEVRAAKGVAAQSGDTVHTGWFAYALIASDTHKAKFEIFSSTDVELAGGTPGVILSLKRGRIHAMFDKITGNEPRVVQTPGALLAVRGTQYTVEVDTEGQTTLDVWEGTVEVRSPLRPQPLLVHAGEAANFSRQQPPAAHPMPQRDRDRDPTKANPADNHGPEGRDGRPNPGDAPGARPGSGSQPPGGNPPPPPGGGRPTGPNGGGPGAPPPPPPHTGHP